MSKINEGLILTENEARYCFALYDVACLDRFYCWFIFADAGCVKRFLLSSFNFSSEQSELPEDQVKKIQTISHQLISEIREQRTKKSGLDAFLYEYDITPHHKLFA